MQVLGLKIIVIFVVLSLPRLTNEFTVNRNINIQLHRFIEKIRGSQKRRFLINCPGKELKDPEIFFRLYYFSCNEKERCPS